MSTPEQPTSDTSTDITTVVRAFYEPFRTGDTSTYDHVLAADQVTHEDLIAAGDKVAVRNTVSGTHQGAFMGHQPTGRRIEMRTMDIHQVLDGRIVTTWHLEDFAGLMAQLTAGPGAPAHKAWA
jgi:predicted ester cyclase